MDAALERFSPATREWFDGAFPHPTAAQAGAWEAIASGRHALVVAPTGSGKTLSAFLWSLDRLLTAPPAEPARRTRVLYISPLKALGVDVERNLRSPLVGITQTAKRMGLTPPEIRVGVRSGDTPASDRRALVREPPDILITTPESLYLMLTSAARSTLAGVETVIVDEIHAVAATKRGAHLAVTLERLDALLPTPAQRIGLSATVRPLEEVARFLGGREPVTIVSPPIEKTFELRVIVPVEDMTELGARATDASLDADEKALASGGSIWPHVDRAIVEEVLRHRSTIVFANSRRLAERITASMNEIWEELQDSSGLRSDPQDRVSKPPGAGPGPEASRRADGAPQPPRVPAQLMGASGSTSGAEPVLARAHHGSVSKEQRAQIEDDLKSGRLRCVVATSSLELGIDMGAVDLVIQVESPPSVASGLQRVGRAGHQVGEISTGVLFPKHRADLLHTAIATERMREGLIEAIAVPQNPLDILAQQTVASVALDTIEVEEWFETVRRSAPFATLPRSAFEATLDLLSGRYPSDEFAELRPRIVWDRVAGTITGRPGAQRLAVTSGGTIPDRGMFGVFIVGGDEGARRVGELDEEMVYESRVGDVFALGATSWRIEEITSDRVLVSPAFGQPGRVPFWKGDGLGRPAELGRAIGAFQAELASGSVSAERLEADGLDERAARNLLAYVAEQKAATGVVPSDQTLLVERFRDELGDWRLVLHSPYGTPVHAPWALAVAARIRERHGVEGSAMAGDDGIVVRLPETDADPPGAELFAFEPGELEALVTEEVGGSALFASRFRESAARALLLPRRNPGRRSPLWQQRQRSAQLLEVARKYPSFPIILETVREVLQDVYDLPSLRELASSLEARRVRLVEVETDAPSPFARTLLFGYVAAFLYEGDSPLAERRAAALSLDPTLLAELLGRAELRELLDAEVIAQVERELQRLEPERRARDAEGIVDLLRVLGPLSVEEVVARFADPADRVPSRSDGVSRSADPEQLEATLRELARANRVLRVQLAGTERWAVVEDAARLRDALGVPLPIGVPSAFLAPVADPVGDLVSRFLRTHTPFAAADAASRLGLGVAVVTDALRRLAADRRAVEGEFRPGATGLEWVDPEVLRRLRARSLAALRREVEPVPQAALGRFLPDWQHVASEPGRGGLRGVDGLVSAIDQLAGLPLPATSWESLVLPARVRDYTPAMLDELMASGEVVWAGRGELPGGGGWVSLHLADAAPLTLPEPLALEPDPLRERLLGALAGGGGYFFRQLAGAVADPDAEPLTDTELARALWDLVWAGHVTGDTFAGLRARLGATTTRSRATPRSRAHRARARVAASLAASAPPTVAGRWSLLPHPDAVPTARATALAEQLLERYGVVTRGAVQAEGVEGGFALVYRVLSSLEETGRVRRGYFVEQLGAAQFATPATVDRLRAFHTDRTDDAPHLAVTLGATDPANPYGAALAWPRGGGFETPPPAAPQPPEPAQHAIPAGGTAAAGATTPADRAAPAGGPTPVDRVAAAGGVSRSPRHRPGRKAGALVVLVDGELALFVERGGKSVLDFLVPEAEAAREAAAASLAATVRAAGGRLRVERVDGVFAVGTPLGDALVRAGFAPTPQGLRLR